MTPAQLRHLNDMWDREHGVEHEVKHGTVDDLRELASMKIKGN